MENVTKKPQLNFAQWADLVSRVYKANNNGMWAILATVMAVHKDYLSKTTCNFSGMVPTILFNGPVGSGKTQIAHSIASVFHNVDTPVVNLASSTNSYLASTLEKYVNTVIILEEYNEFEVSKNKFKEIYSSLNLKKGKTKDIISGKAIPIMIGQESPFMVDRVYDAGIIVRRLTKKTEWSLNERLIFDALKKYEREGLSNVLDEIVNLKPIISAFFIDSLLIARDDLFKYCAKHEIGVHQNSFKSITMFLAMAGIIFNYSKTKSTLTYEEFFTECVDQLLRQSKK
jgi:hypothetical protein